MHDTSVNNPYSASTTGELITPDLYRGEGNVDIQAEGDVMRIRWDSTTVDSLELNTYLLTRQGTLQEVRRRQKLYLAFGVFFSLLGLATLISKVLPDTPAGVVASIFLVVVGPVLILIGSRYRSAFMSKLEQAVMHARGGPGTIEVGAAITPSGISEQERQYIMTFLWPGVSSVEVTNYGIVVLSDHAGSIQLPLRIFRDEVAAQRCVALLKRFWEPARDHGRDR